MYSLKFLEDKTYQMMAWGKYIWWAYKQREQFENELREDNDNYPMHFLYLSQWYASLHVVVEGWESLKEADETIEKLLSQYQDFTLLIKRCRNATYHYQKSILDKRIYNSLEENELVVWAGALLDEFIRYLYIFPFKHIGICEESLYLHKEYLELIGWVPKDHTWVKWYDSCVMAYHYYAKTKSSPLDCSSENDLKMEKFVNELKRCNPNPYLPMLSRMKFDT